MAASYNTDLQNITLAESTTGWSALGGSILDLNIGVDFAMQGINCVDRRVSSAEKGQIYNFGSTITPGTNTHFFVWVFLATPGLADTLANRGLGVVIGTSTTAYNTFHVEGKDTYGASGRVGKCYPIRYVTSSSSSPPYRTLTGSPGANPQYFGAKAKITGAVKGANLGVDAIRYGTGIFITSGDSSAPGTFTEAATINDNINNRWGIITSINGSFELQGKFVVGQNTSGTPTAAYFSDSNKTIAIVDTPHSLTNFTQIIVDHASTTFNLMNCTFQALGTNNRGQLIFNNASTISTLSSCIFSGIDATILRAGVTADSCTWQGTGQITANDATITNCTVSNYSGVSDSSALVWNTATDPNGYLDGTVFIKGANSTHGLELGTSCPTTITLPGVTFSGYNTSNGQTDSAIYVRRTTGTVNIYVDSGAPSYKTDGATVNIISGIVSVSLTAQTVDGTPVSGATVFVKATGTGYFPVNAPVTISNSGTTATVTHTSHGLATGDKVYIKGASLNSNNGVFSITVTGVNTYTYTMLSSPSSSPTGTITSTFVILSGTTDSSGQISMSRVFPSNQSFTGWARKSSSAPFYKTGQVGGTVYATTGANMVALMILDQ